MLVDTTPTPPLQPQQDPALDIIENKIRAHIYATRVRLQDVFMDFDKLRSGKISSFQFRRCVSSALDRGVVKPLSEEEYEVLGKFYGEKGVVRWTEFVSSIDKVFGAQNLEQSPTQYIPSPREVVKPLHPKSKKSEEIFANVLAMLKSFVKHHGSDVKSWFEDFDKHNNGYVTRNQFRRGVPRNLLSVEEEDIIMDFYSDESNNTVNYFKFNNDVNRKVRRPRLPMNAPPSKNKEGNIAEFIPIGTEELLNPRNRLPLSNPIHVENKIKKNVYRERIRLIEFFKDYDRHNCGVITETQFRAGLRLSELILDELEIKALVSVYKTIDGRLGYRKFCASIDSIFTITGLEKNPLAQVSPPTREFLNHIKGELSPPEEARVKEILAKLSIKIKERRPLLTPYFKDFDKTLSLGDSGLITKGHFSRLLSALKLDVGENDLKILFKKYECQRNHAFYYMDFIHDVDQTTRGINTAVPQIECETTTNDEPKRLPLSVPELIKKIQYQVSTKRIRVAEFFKNFDKLRSYLIKSEEFVRGTNRIGLDLMEVEYQILADHYRDAEKTDLVRWKDFEQDIEFVFGEIGLESRPTVVPQKASVQQTPFVLESTLTTLEETLLTQTIHKMKEHLKLRQSSIKPFFKDFDKLYTGFVSRSQFRQCLTYAQCNVTDQEFCVLSKKWGKGNLDRKIGGEGVCYLLFLEALENESKDKLASILRNDSANSAAFGKIGKGYQKKLLDAVEFEKLMNRIKTKVKTQRVRVIDFMQDFDHLKHGKITKNEFRRALNVLFTNLNEIELYTLETHYQNEIDKTLVNYVKFSDHLESVFTQKGLEKDPTTVPKTFSNYIYETGVAPLKSLQPRGEEDAVLTNALRRLRERVKQRRVDVLNYLEDYDFVNEGTITTNQFRAVLGTIGLAVDDKEILALSTRFGTTTNKDRINYRVFSSCLEEEKDLDDGKTWTREIRKNVASHSLW